jgi:hypothetical protein
VRDDFHWMRCLNSLWGRKHRITVTRIWPTPSCVIIIFSQIEMIFKIKKITLAKLQAVVVSFRDMRWGGSRVMNPPHGSYVGLI